MAVDVEDSLKSWNEVFQRHETALGTMALDDSREHGDVTGGSPRSAVLTSPSTSSHSTRMTTMEESNSHVSEEVPEKDHSNQSSRQERDGERATLRLKTKTMPLEPETDRANLRVAMATSDTIRGKNDSILSMVISDLHNSDRMLEARQQLEQLEARLVVLQEENLNLGGRLERAAIEILSLDAERKHAEEVEKENKKLRRQLREYEDLMTSMCKANPSAGVTITSNKREKKLAKLTQSKKGNSMNSPATNESEVESNNAHVTSPVAARTLSSRLFDEKAHYFGRSFQCLQASPTSKQGYYQPIRNDSS
jgi:hypothetical protein